MVLSRGLAERSLAHAWELSSLVLGSEPVLSAVESWGLGSGLVSEPGSEPGSELVSVLGLELVSGPVLEPGWGVAVWEAQR